jgi:hypothetical protein
MTWLLAWTVIIEPAADRHQTASLMFFDPLVVLRFPDSVRFVLAAANPILLWQGLMFLV